MENQKPGNPQSEWDLNGRGAYSGSGVTHFIEGFAIDLSFNNGQTVNFKINTDSNNYRIDIYRLGYYGGLGARKITTIQRTTASVQPAPLTNTSLGPGADDVSGLVTT